MCEFYEQTVFILQFYAQNDNFYLVSFCEFPCNRITSNNNSRMYNGTTENELNDPHAQIVRLMDPYRIKGVYKMQFTDSELSSVETFCKGISGIIEVIHCK